MPMFQLFVSYIHIYDLVKWFVHVLLLASVGRRRREAGEGTLCTCQRTTAVCDFLRLVDSPHASEVAVWCYLYLDHVIM